MSDIKDKIMDFMAVTGSTWCKLKDLQEAEVDLKGMDEAIENGNIIYYEKDGDDMFSIPEYTSLEDRLAANISRVRNAPHTPLPQSQIEEMIDQVEKENGFPYCDEQRNAIAKVINNQICIITGGPGTGKTTTLTGALKGLEFAGCVNNVFSAPTGKAASRMEESSGKKASTLHATLHIGEGRMDPVTLMYDAVVVDEISMLDLELADALFRAIPTGTRLIMLGDTDQLPSVGAGAILRDMIDSGVIPVAPLVKTFRQDNESTIFANMKKIRIGDDSIMSSKNWAKHLTETDKDGKVYNDAEDFYIMNPTEKFSAVHQMLYIYKKEFDRLGGPEQVCLLTPFRNEEFKSSSEYLNKQIQHLVNPNGEALVTTNNGCFRVGDPVMQLKNREECANGDVGKVIKILNAQIMVKFPRSTVTYERSELENKDLVLAYAMSIHKSQGSEYKTVITCLLKEHAMMASRNLLYTAVTRAKQKLFLVCEDEAVKDAIAYEASSKRVTLLAEKIRYQSLKQSFQFTAA